jgi:hypothetical protein
MRIGGGNNGQDTDREEIAMYTYRPGVKWMLVAVIVPAMMTGAARGHVILALPNGGETLTASNVYSVTWHVQITHTVENWDLWYSTSGDSGSWIDLALDLPTGDTTVGSVHTYDWTIPDAYTNQARVRVRMDVVAGSPSGPWYDISDADFTIIPEPASVSLLAVGAIGLLIRRRSKGTLGVQTGSPEARAQIHSPHAGRLPSPPDRQLRIRT